MNDAIAPWLEAAHAAWSPSLQDKAEYIWLHCIPDAGTEKQTISDLLRDPDSLDREIVGDRRWTNVAEGFVDFIGFARTPERLTDYRLVYYICCLHITFFLKGVSWEYESYAAAMVGALWASVRAGESSWLAALEKALADWPDAFDHPSFNAFPRAVCSTARAFSHPDAEARYITADHLLQLLDELFVSERAKEMAHDLAAS